MRGTPSTIQAFVRNGGEASAQAFNATVFVDTNGDRLPQSSEVVRTQYVANLNPGSTLNVFTQWTPSTSGNFIVCTIADPDGLVEESNESNNLACGVIEVGSGVCPLSQGYWKNHAEAWPVDALVLGNRTYTKAELLALLRTPPRGDASVILAHQLIAAKLNVLAGADPTAAQAVLAEAEALMARSGTLPSGEPPSSPLGQRMTEVGRTLDDFNNGRLSPGC
jgi:hypothetical protein